MNTRPAGMPTPIAMDDLGELQCSSSRRASSAERGGAPLAELVIRDVEGEDLRARRDRVKRANVYRRALDAQVALEREFVERDRSAASREDAARARARAAHEDAMRERERAEANRRRREYVAYLDRQVRERRERERVARDLERRMEQEEEDRIRLAVEEERAILQEKRLAMAAREALIGDEKKRRSPRVTHSPPASPRVSPRIVPSSTGLDAAEVAERNVSAPPYVTIPEYIDVDRLTTTTTTVSAPTVDAATASELASIIKELVVETRELRARLSRADDELARMRAST